MRFRVLFRLLARTPVLIVGLTVAFGGIEAFARDRALLIGISQYKYIDSLRYADADAKELANWLTTAGGFSKRDVTLLLNGDARKGRIYDAFRELVQESQRQPLGRVVVMFAGHGVSRRETPDAFLAPADAADGVADFYATGLGPSASARNDTYIERGWFAKQLSAIRASSVLVILDSCYSGVPDFADEVARQFGFMWQSGNGWDAERRGIVPVRRDATGAGTVSLPSGEVRALLAASGANQQSIENARFRHGALSYAMFETFRTFQGSLAPGERKGLPMGVLYDSVLKVFHRERVDGRRLLDLHQPMLLPVPDEADVLGANFLVFDGGPNAVASTGRLRLEGELGGGVLYVDGTAATLDSTQSVQLSEGKHQIEWYLPRTAFRDPRIVEIIAGRTVTIPIRSRGRLEVRSQFEGSARWQPLIINLDGVEVGRNEFRSTSLLAGMHELTVTWGSQKRSRKIEIRPDSPLEVIYTVRGTARRERSDGGPLQ